MRERWDWAGQPVLPEEQEEKENCQVSDHHLELQVP